MRNLKLKPSEMWSSVAWYISTNDSEEPVTSIFRDEEVLSYPEYGGNRSIRKVGTYLPNYTASHSRRP
jgi:hypothetical protein